MSAFRIMAMLAALLVLASSGAVVAGQRARLGVGLVILPECPPVPTTAAGAATHTPGQDADPPEPFPDAEALRRCQGEVARVDIRPEATLEPAASTRRPGTQALVIEF